MDKNQFLPTDDALSAYTAKLGKWFRLLNEIMPDYFFTTFTATEIQDILPALLSLRNDSGIQQIHMGSTVILIYYKSEENNLVKTARMMRRFDIVGASIHESKEKVVVDGVPATLVIEYYKVGVTELKLPPCHTKREILDAYRKLFRETPKTLSEIYDRVNWNAARDLDAERLAERLHIALLAQEEDRILLDAQPAGKDEIRLTMALSNCPTQGFYYKYIECLYQNGFQVQRAYLRKLTTQENCEAFHRMPVSVNTLYVKCDRGGTLAANNKRIREMLSELPHIKWVPVDDLLHQELVLAKGWPLSRTNLIRAAAEFIHTQLSFVDRHAYNAHDIFRLLALYEPLLDQFCHLFEATFSPAEPAGNDAKIQKSVRSIEAHIEKINTGSHEKDTLVKTILRCVLNFFRNILKTNYYVEEKSVLSFRLDPAFMAFYDEQFPAYRKAFPSDRPFGIFYFYRENGIGFHVRFSDIARGGWRSVIPAEATHRLERQDAFSLANDEIFREVFVLAHTQHMKNKDIYEGGAKMICLMRKTQEDPRPKLFEVQRSTCRAFLDLVDHDAKGKLKNRAVRDRYGKPEIIEIGPDENMFDSMIRWIGDHALKVGYRLGGGLISGKPDTGINHKHYGVTSYGVHQYLLKTLAELGIDPAKDVFSVKISGGPFGDVAGNELKLLLQRNGTRRIYPGLRIVAVTDGPAAVYDPEGIDPDELESLIHKHGLEKFRPEKLRGDGSFMIFSQPVSENGGERYRLAFRKGKSLQEKMLGRDEFMQIFQSNLLVHYADVFLPCGGRPATINETNWEAYLPDGSPSSRAIIEGANSFLTPGARDRLQEKGVWIIKDASANKCGVITSSYEILTGLMLDPQEFEQHRDRLIPEIMEILKVRACREADWLYAQFRESGTPMTVLTEKLSIEINAKNVEIQKFLHDHPEKIKPELVFAHLPPLLVESFRDRLSRIPLVYQEAIAAVELASRIVYGKVHRIEEEVDAVLATIRKKR